MFEQYIDQSGPSLGSFVVQVMTFNTDGSIDTVKPIWGLRNHQGPNWMYGQAKVQSSKQFAVRTLKFILYF